MIKASIFLICCTFTNTLVYSQGGLKNDGKMNCTYGDLVEIKLNKEVHFEDSLSLMLTSFSHKRSQVGGPTKATAYLTLSNGSVSEQILLSIHGVDGRDNYIRYDSLAWREYEIQLKDFDYDAAVKIIVTKRR